MKHHHHRIKIFLLFSLLLFIHSSESFPNLIVPANDQNLINNTIIGIDNEHIESKTKLQIANEYNVKNKEIDINNDDNQNKIVENEIVNNEIDESSKYHGNRKNNPFKKIMKDLVKHYGKDQMESKVSFLSIESELIKAYMNTSVDPCDDFYEYACGNWHIQNPMPAEDSEYHIFKILNTRISSILKYTLADEGARDQLEAKAKMFYKTCMDTEKINERSIKPLLENFIESLGGWPVLNEKWSENNFDLIDLLVKTQKFGVKTLLTVDVDLNVYNAENYVIHLESAELGIQDHVDYLFFDEDDPAAHDAYKNLIITVLKYFNVQDEKSKSFAEEIILIEKDILLNRLESMSETYFEYFISSSLQNLTDDYSDFEWNRFFNLTFNREISPNQTIILHSIADVKKFMEFLMTSDKRILANYIIWKSVYHLIPALDDRFVAAKLSFLKVLQGMSTTIPRWKICTSLANDNMGLLMTSFLVDLIGLDENGRSDAMKIVEELRKEFFQTLSKLDWIDDETRKSAELKINSIILSVGYPEITVNREELTKYYSNIQIEDEKYFENSLNLFYNTKLNTYNLLNTKSNSFEWPLSPAVADAFFLPTQNRIFIPAGIIQPPLYHKDYPKALKYGGMGSFIGHELTHGFDSTGRLFDSKGNLKAWWGNDSIESFNNKSQCFREQYGNFSMHGLQLDGKISLKENIADNGGIRESFSVYKNWLQNATSEELKNEKLPHLDIEDEKLFFIGFAQTWCSSFKLKALEHKLSTDSHPPGKFRVQGVLQNSQEFSRVYNCPMGSLMNPEKKCKLW